MDTASSKNQPDDASDSCDTPCKDTAQHSPANSVVNEAQRNLFFQRCCYNRDPEICFCNILKMLTNMRAEFRDFDYYLNHFKRLEFDKTLNVDINVYKSLFNTYYNGFKRKFNPKKAKKNGLYGAEVFTWTIEHFLTETDYRFKKQKIRAEEFQFIAYLLTDLCLKFGDNHMVHSNFFLGKDEEGNPCKNVERYRTCTQRKINKDKLNYIIDVLSKYDIVIEQKVGVKGKTHLRNFYSIGKNNPYDFYLQWRKEQDELAKQREEQSKKEAEAKKEEQARKKTETQKIERHVDAIPPVVSSVTSAPSPEQQSPEEASNVSVDDDTWEFFNGPVMFNGKKYEMIQGSIVIEGITYKMDDELEIKIGDTNYIVSFSTKTDGYATMVPFPPLKDDGPAEE